MTFSARFFHISDASRFRIERLELKVCFFRWILDLRKFEIVHGFYRILLLLPDKLLTALHIRSLNLPDPNDDGRFLIKLVLDLIEVSAASDSLPCQIVAVFLYSNSRI